MLGSFLTLALHGGGVLAEASSWDRYAWVTASGGNESDRVFDPDLGIFSVPGGDFLNLTPGLTLTGQLGRRTRLTVNGQGTVEQFNNSADRTLLSGAATADLRRQIRGPLQVGATLGGNYYSDSAQESVNRLSGGAELAAGYVRSRWYLDVLGSAQARRYANLRVAAADGSLQTYTENAFEYGIEGALQPVEAVVLTAFGSRQHTDATDRLFDSRSWIFRGTARVRILSRTWVMANALVQQRRYTSRVMGFDEDRYRQAGVGVEQALAAGIDLGVHVVLARYTTTSGDDEDFHRVSASVTWWIGRSPRVAPPITLPVANGGQRVSSTKGDGCVLRLHAPGAQRVLVIGDFNGWNGTPMRLSGDGWWELTLSLSPGAYQYAYIVDGETMTPPEAGVTVDDGFGGRNGLLEIFPDDA